MKLHGFSHSSAAYRVRALLHLKGFAFVEIPHDLLAGEQNRAAYRALNPQGLVTAIETDEGDVLTQSMAICEYLEELAPEPPLLPRDPVRRAKVRAVALAVACEIHPLQNRKLLLRLRDYGPDKSAVESWTQQVISGGLDTVKAMVIDEPGPFCFGDVPSLADVSVIPQLGNARRIGVAPRWPRLQQAEQACMTL